MSARDGSNTIGPGQNGEARRGAAEWEEEQTSDDDMDYRLPDGDEDDDDEEDEEEDGEENESLYESAEDFDGEDLQMSGVSIEFGEPGGRTTQIPLNSTSVRQMLGSNDLRRILLRHGLLAQFAQEVEEEEENGEPEDEDEDDDDDYVPRRYGMRQRGGRPLKRARHAMPPVPDESGQELMQTGGFGDNETYEDRKLSRKKKLAQRLMHRELGIGTPQQQRRTNRTMMQGLIPASTPDKIIHYDNRCYSGQFSEDGDFFFSCSQDFKVRMYDTSNPFDWKYYKSVDYPFGQWTITDATLSPNNKLLAYSSIKNIVCLAPTDPANQSPPTMLDFLRTEGGGYSSRHSFGIWSVRFSGSGTEIVAGTSIASVIVYDIERQTPVLSINKHEEDVNAVCFGDKNSPHILYSGSDDTTLRVWDRRSMRDGREAGAFVGHTEGLTYVDSKGDGRYVLSNGKDQTMKLWDLRKMMTTASFAKLDPMMYTTGFDYRFTDYTAEDWTPHPHDNSVVTFRGHRVLKTLIRCHFSPPNSTNSRYVYTGSEDGCVWVYNLDGTVAGKIDVGNSTKNTRPRHPDLMGYTYEDFSDRNGHWRTCVRDASWHPNAPILAATSWNGYSMAAGTCTLHTYTGDPNSKAPPPTSPSTSTSTLPPGTPRTPYTPISDEASNSPMGTGYDAELRYRRDFNRGRKREDVWDEEGDPNRNGYAGNGDGNPGGRRSGLRSVRVERIGGGAPGAW